MKTMPSSAPGYSSLSVTVLSHFSYIPGVESFKINAPCLRRGVLSQDGVTQGKRVYDAALLAEHPLDDLSIAVHHVELVRLIG